MGMCIHSKKVLLSHCQTDILYPLHNWGNIWKNLHFRYIPVNTREILYKYINEISTNKHRLKQIRRSVDDLCEHCNIPKTNIHMLYY